MPASPPLFWTLDLSSFQNSTQEVSSSRRPQLPSVSPPLPQASPSWSSLGGSAEVAEMERNLEEAEKFHQSVLWLGGSPTREDLRNRKERLEEWMDSPPDVPKEKLKYIGILDGVWQCLACKKPGKPKKFTSEATINSHFSSQAHQKKEAEWEVSLSNIPEHDKRLKMIRGAFGIFTASSPSQQMSDPQKPNLIENIHSRLREVMKLQYGSERLAGHTLADPSSEGPVCTSSIPMKPTGGQTEGGPGDPFYPINCGVCSRAIGNWEEWLDHTRSKNHRKRKNLLASEYVRYVQELRIGPEGGAQKEVSVYFDHISGVWSYFDPGRRELKRENIEGSLWN